MRDFRLSPHVVYVGEPVTATFLASGADACALSFDREWPERALSDVEIAAGTAVFTLDHPTSGSALFARLRCEGPGGSDDAFDAIEPIATSVRATLSSSPEGVPGDTGGDVALCWQASSGTCAIASGEEAIASGLAASGCQGDVRIDHTRTFTLTCCDGDACGTDTRTVPRGPSISTFDVDRRVFAAPGDVEIRWAAQEVAGCALLANAAAIDVPLSGLATVLLGHGLHAITVECVDPEGEPVSRSVDVAVGPAVVGFEAWSVNPGEIEARWTGQFVEGCDLQIRSGERTQWLPDVGTGGAAMDLGVNFPADPGLRSSDLLLLCEGFIGRNQATITVFERDPVRLVEVWAEPDGLPSSGGEVDVCWASGDADACQFGPPGQESPVATSGCTTEWVPADGSIHRRVLCHSGTSRAIRDVTVDAGPSAALRVEPSFLAEPGDVALTWSIVEANACVVTIDPSVHRHEEDDSTAFSVERTGSASVAVDGDTRFGIVCRSSDGEPLSDDNRVDVGPRIDRLSATGDATGLRIEWASRGFDACTLDVANAREAWLLDPAAVSTAEGSTVPGRDGSLVWRADLFGAGDTRVVLNCRAPSGNAERRLVYPDPDAP